MATQKGIIKIAGTLDGLCFYLYKGKPVVRVAGGGFNGKRIKTEKRYVRTRENATEFGRCSNDKKWFRIALAPFLAHIKDSSQHGRLMKTFPAIRDLDRISERGKRRVYQGLETDTGKRLLQAFNFTPEFSKFPLLGTKGVWNVGDSQLTVRQFDASKHSFPKPATHFQLQLGYWILDFENQTKSYTLSNPLWVGKDDSKQDIALKVAPPEDDGIHLVYLQVRYFQELNGNLYALEGPKMVGMECLYCG